MILSTMPALCFCYTKILDENDKKNSGFAFTLYKINGEETKPYL